MRVTRLSLRNFRSYEAEEVRLGPGLTVITGPNGAGKTNLLEALYFACTGRSCRTGNEREVVRFGAGVARLELDAERDGDSHRITVGFEPGEAKRLAVDGAPVDRLTDSAARPLVSVFLPDRLDLVLGAPALRRAHLDQVIAALWPTRVGTRRAYSAALAQRNALLGAIRAGRAGRGSLPAWDQELARHGVALAADRAAAVAELDAPFAAHAEALGLEGGAELAYRPRSKAASAEELAAELAERADSDLERGFTGHGPHRDELVLAPRRPRAADLRLARAAAARAAGAAAGRARRARRRARGRAADAARRRHLGARHAAPRAARRPAARGRRPERDRDDRPRARAGRRRARRRAPRGRRGIGPGRRGGAGVRRGAPRPVGAALDGLTASLAPATLLAEVQRAWPAAAGEAFAQASEPVSERDGVVTVACTSAVWAQELDLLSERVLARLADELGRPAVTRLRAQARPASR